MSTPADDKDKNLSEGELDDVAGGAFEIAGRPPSGIGEIHEVGISEACLNPQPLPP